MTRYEVYFLFSFKNNLYSNAKYKDSTYLKSNLIIEKDISTLIIHVNSLQVSEK